MNSNSVAQRSLSLTTLCLIAFLVLNEFAAPLSSAQQRRASKTATSTNVQREEIATLLRKAAALLQEGKFDEAEPLVRRAVTSEPVNADAHNLMGAILDQRGQVQAAEREYLEALRLNPRSISARVNLGVLFAKTNRAEQAVQIFEAVLHDIPNHPQAMLNLGILYATRGEYSRAVPLLQQANAWHPKTFAVIYNLGIAFYQLKRIDEAQSALESASTIAPDDPGPLYYLGLVADSRGQSETATQLWEKALALRPNFPEANFMLGEVLRREGHLESAKEFYERALAQDPAKVVYYIRLGGVDVLLKLYDQALEVFQRAAQRFPDVAEAHYFVGIAARGSASYDVAESALRKSLALQPDNFDALAQLGFILGEHDRLAEAEQLLKRAITLSNGKHFYAQYDLGRLLVKSKRFEEAIRILQNAALIRPNNPGVHYQLFMAFSRSKRKEEADHEMAIFKKLDEEGKTRQQNNNEIDSDDAANPPATVKPVEPLNNTAPKIP